MHDIFQVFSGHLLRILPFLLLFALTYMWFRKSRTLGFFGAFFLWYSLLLLT